MFQDGALLIPRKVAHQVHVVTEEVLEVFFIGPIIGYQVVILFLRVCDAQKIHLLFHGCFFCNDFVWQKDFWGQWASHDLQFKLRPLCQNHLTAHHCHWRQWRSMWGVFFLLFKCTFFIWTWSLTRSVKSIHISKLSDWTTCRFGLTAGVKVP